MKQVFNMATVGLSLVGMADAGYITLEKIIGGAPKCGFGFDCGAVLNSPWASVGPIPLAGIGFFYYLTVLILASMAILDIKLPKFSPIKDINLVLLLLTGFGFLFSIYLISIMAFAIKAWCLYCLVSASTCALLFAVNAVRWTFFRHE